MDSASALRQLNASWPQTIAAMHGSGRKAVLAITGGGSGAIAELLRVPGGSRLLLEALVPYDARASCRRNPVIVVGGPRTGVIAPLKGSWL